MDKGKANSREERPLAIFFQCLLHSTQRTKPVPGSVFAVCPCPREGISDVLASGPIIRVHTVVRDYPPGVCRGYRIRFSVLYAEESPAFQAFIDSLNYRILSTRVEGNERPGAYREAGFMAHPRPFPTTLRVRNTADHLRPTSPGVRRTSFARSRMDNIL